jgi:aspartate racemase
MSELRAERYRDVHAPDIQQVFEDRVKRTPDRPALAFAEETLTYVELNRRANRLARRLKVLGIGPNQLVAICLPRSLDMMIAILGILKSGGAWLPIDPNQPAARQEALLHNARCGLLLADTSIASNMARHPARTIFLDQEWQSLLRLEESDVENVSTPADLAYVMNTSGSTGQPKGVLISRSNLSHYVHSISQALAIDHDDTYLHTANVAFSSSVRQLMVPLTQGASIVIAGTDEIRQPGVLFDTIKRRRATVMDVVPTYWRNCIDVLESLDEKKRASSLDNHLRLIVSTGEPLFPDVPARWWRLESRTRLVNLFGQTETTGTVATYPIGLGGSTDANTVPIGGPIADTEIYLLDAQQQLVPMETEGEIFVGGPTVGLGYLNQPALTAEKFVPNSLATQSGARLYRTGDLARFRADGEMEYVSRIDDQVKIRGIRIELGEVRAVLSRHPAIHQCAVIAVGEQRGKRLVAYVAPKYGAAITVGDLRNFLTDQLPDYMIPSSFVIMDALPLTASGKIDRQNLPVADHYAPGSSFVAPRTPVEEAVAAIWAQVLGVERVGAYDDFFELGGHSLAVGQILSRVTEEFELELSLKSLFEAPTVAEMAVVITQLQAAKAGSESLEPMLAELELLSDEEAERLLSRKQAGNP